MPTTRRSSGSSQTQLRRAIATADRLYNAGNPKWFDFLAKDAVVYSIGRTKPFKGRASYQKHFAPNLTAGRRRTRILSRDIKLMDGHAVVAQTLQITQQKVTANVRQSVVWSSDASGWKIRHLHTALVGSPSSSSSAATSGAVEVLNERIATMAAVLGVAQ